MTGSINTDHSNIEPRFKRVRLFWQAVESSFSGSVQRGPASVQEFDLIGPHQRLINFIKVDFPSCRGPAYVIHISRHLRRAPNLADKPAKPFVPRLLAA